VGGGETKEDAIINFKKKQLLISDATVWKFESRFGFRIFSSQTAVSF